MQQRHVRANLVQLVKARQAHARGTARALNTVRVLFLPKNRVRVNIVVVAVPLTDDWDPPAALLLLPTGVRLEEGDLDPLTLVRDSGELFEDTVVHAAIAGRVCLDEALELG